MSNPETPTKDQSGHCGLNNGPNETPTVEALEADLASLRVEQPCTCGHDGPTQHTFEGRCRVCPCEMFDWAVPRIVLREFPGGVSCGACGRAFADGDRFAERMEQETEGVPVMLVVCEPCAWPASAEPKP